VAQAEEVSVDSVASAREVIAVDLALTMVMEEVVEVEL